MNFLKDLFGNKGKDKPSELSKLFYGSDVEPVYLVKLECNLIPGEVVLLDWLQNKNTDKKCPDYFPLLYGVNTKESIKRMMKNGFIRYSTPKESLASLKLESLKDILESKGLPKTGRKADLIARIQKELLDSDLSGFINNKSYTLTDKGKVLLEEYYYIPYAHKNRMEVLSVAEMLEYTREEREKLARVDIGTEILLKRLRLSIENKDFSIARNCFLNLAKINNSNKDVGSCINAYLCMFICDVSGWANNGDYHENNIMDEHCGTIAPRLIGKKIDMNNLRVHFDDAWLKIGNAFPKHYLGKEKTYECLVAGFNKDTATIRRLLNLDNRKERDYSSYKF